MEASVKFEQKLAAHVKNTVNNFMLITNMPGWG